MVQLRQHLCTDEFQQKVTQQFKNDYQLVYLLDDERVKAVADYQFGNSLAWGKFLYIDDMVTDKNNRSKGYGKLLLEWLINKAEQQQCDQLHLDSGMQRIDAHRFYKKNLTLTGKHYSYTF